MLLPNSLGSVVLAPLPQCSPWSRLFLTFSVAFPAFSTTSCDADLSLLQTPCSLCSSLTGLCHKHFSLRLCWYVLRSVRMWHSSCCSTIPAFLVPRSLSPPDLICCSDSHYLFADGPHAAMSPAQPQSWPPELHTHAFSTALLRCLHSEL